MKGSTQAVLMSIIIILLVSNRTNGDPRSQIIKLSCNQQLPSDEKLSLSNVVQSMEKIGTQMGNSLKGTASTGTGPESNYGLAECYGDLSTEDCILCYADAHVALLGCFPYNGQVFLDGCFMRTENYNFYDEYAGKDDTLLCGNETRSGVFWNSVRQAVADAVRDAPTNNDYFARKVAMSGTMDDSAYVLANCWHTLNKNSCKDCLERGSESILKCLPSSEGRLLETGCFMRYSDTNFLNARSNGGVNGAHVYPDGGENSEVILLSCASQQIKNITKFIPNFLHAMEDITTKMQTSFFGTNVTAIKPDIIYGLAQCFGDLSTSECLLCYAVARTTLTRCLPGNGGQVYLNGCYMRFENYSFFGQQAGNFSYSRCANEMMRDSVFVESARKAVLQAVETAPKSKNARTEALISPKTNNSVYAVADCWNTLDTDSCGACLQKAAAPMLSCLPASQGSSLYSGCFMRYSVSDLSYTERKRSFKGKKLAILMAIISSVLAFLVGSIIAFYAWKRRSDSKRKGFDDTKLLEIMNGSNLNVKYSTIEKATSSFDEANILGKGGFGTVYKGVLPDGKEIAVKRLFFNHRHRARDFYNEVNIISSVDHKNLVKLVGFSCLGPESILLYEYLPNRSLDHFIFDATRGKELDWAKRYDIILGIAEGLSYLHENSKRRIIHRDIKAANVLLDSRLHAKIADFGLARSYQQDKNHISTGIAGTLGYMAPEYISHGKLTEKVDVYSFGVLLLEIVSGIPNRGIQTSEYTQSLVSIAWEHFKQGSVEELVDPNLILNNQTSSKMKKEIKSMVHIAFLCIQEVASLRPTMSMALQMLSKNIEPLPSPANPPYIPETTKQLNEFGRIQRLNNPYSVPTVSNSSGIPR
ncbi:cysteine-rich receptor-like protein kinase 2 [Artemisia annua]|uniref:Cysteine-rich receptor-like protein kinase 2 n=1 Tax=Artemisia annua TaxID=35608 RepID=A0A2U1QJ35_ARTAN|nr:cysteine-rich receptor-like protein kinase 2 [Artemisia annua]